MTGPINEEMSEIFLQRLDRAMEARSMTVQELASRSGVGASSIYGYTLKNRLPRLDMAVKIADTLRVSVDWLCGRKSSVRGGHWVPESETGIRERFMCSRCGASFQNLGQDKYCRECGARMMGWEKDG